MATATGPDAEGLRRSGEPTWLGVAGGLGAIAALAALDAAWDASRVISATVVVGPFLTALLAPARWTAAVGLVAVLTVLASGIWNENFGQDAYWLRAVVAAAGGGLAVAGAQGRERLAQSRRRFALLAALAEVGDGSETLDETVRLLLDLLVPEFADACVVDLVQDGEVRRLGVRIDGDDGTFERWLGGRTPEQAAVDLSSRGAAEAGRVRLMERLDPEMVRRFAHDEEDARMLVGLGGRSSMTVPLRARNRTVGALSLSMTERSGRSYGPEDARFAEVMAGRAALALDNAGLFAELQTTEAQLSAALGSLSDAVTVQTAHGRLLYANEAAAAAMGFTSAREMLAKPPQQISERYDAFTEDGRPLHFDQLPGQRVLAGERPEPMVVRWRPDGGGDERWSVVKSTAVSDRRGLPMLAVNVIEDITGLKRAEFGQRLLARAGELLSSSLEYERTLQQVADLAVPELADWCGVSFPDGHGHLRQVAVAHVDPERVRFAREVAARYPVRVDAPTGGPEVLRTGVSQVVNEIPPELLRESAQDEEHHELLLQVGMRAVMIVPMLVGGTAIGTLTLVREEHRQPFDDADLGLAEELGRRAGTAVQNARLYTERSHIAETLQAGLLPQPLPDLPGWSVASLYRPAGEENLVGGDFYDAYPVRGGWLVVVGDVVGRGAPAAALTALARYTLRAVAQLLDDPLDAVARLNDELYSRGRGGLCTLACALLRERGAEGEATVLCAGHPKPFVVRRDGAEQVGRFGPIVGAFADVGWERVTVRLAPEDTLVLYTDGVIDSVGEHERFGEERLGEVLARGADGVSTTVRHIADALDDFAGGDPADDTAVVALRRVPGDPAQRVTFAAGAGAPADARRAAAAALDGRLDEQTAADATMLVSEVVANAFRHGDGAEIGLTIHVLDQRIRVEVRDGGPGFERPEHPQPRVGGGGFGLVLVDALSRDWGVHVDGGTCVWFELDA